MMKTILEVVSAINIVQAEEEKLSGLKDETYDIANKIDLNEIENTLNYAEARYLYLRLKKYIDKDITKKIENIIHEKKIKEYPQILDVHYYPTIKEIDFLAHGAKVELDKLIKNSYQDHRNSVKRKIANLDPKILSFLLDNNILEKEYIFHCNCGSNECYDKAISEDYFYKLKDYWHKLSEGIKTTSQEDEELNYGCFESGCWNDGTVEVCSLNDWNKNLRRIDYEIIQKPDMTLDNL